LFWQVSSTGGCSTDSCCCHCQSRTIVPSPSHTTCNDSAPILKLLHKLLIVIALQSSTFTSTTSQQRSIQMPQAWLLWPILLWGGVTSGGYGISMRLLESISGPVTLFKSVVYVNMLSNHHMFLLQQAVSSVEAYANNLWRTDFALNTPSTKTRHCCVLSSCILLYRAQWGNTGRNLLQVMSLLGQSECQSLKTSGRSKYQGIRKEQGRTLHGA
jgi:hypothetical protein